MERLTYRGTPQMTEDGMVTPSYCDYPVRRIIERLAEYEDIGTVEDFKYLKQSEHGYDNCHNLTCRTKCEKGGYAKAVDDFAEVLRQECLKSVYHEVWLHTILKIAKKLKGETV